MLRLTYLAFLYWWYGGSLSSLSEELTAASCDLGSAATSTSPPPPAPYNPSEGNSTPPAPSTDSQLQHSSTSPIAAALGNAERGIQSTPEQGQDGVRGGRGDDKLRKELDQLLRVSIVDKLTALTVLISIVSDMDVLADWYFFKEGLEGQTMLLFILALIFTVVGTIMYVLLALEFHPISKVRARMKGKPLSPLQHVPLGWQLAINVVVEDIPQLVITCMASPDSVAGVLNIATAGFSLMAKIAEGFATRKDLPMSSQLRMIEEDPGVVRHMMVQRRNAEGLAAIAAKLVVFVSQCREETEYWKRQRWFAFQVMQLDPGFLNGSLNYVREKLEIEELDLAGLRLKGSIPPALGELTAMTTLYLQVNRFTGSIPPALGQLTALTTLDLSNNKLTGAIPAALAGLTALKTLDLRVNQLTGSIPPALGGLTALKNLDLRENQLTGSIPPALRGLVALKDLSLSKNQLTGSIPPALGELTALKTLDLSNNQLTGPIPPALGELTTLRKLDLSYNQLTGPIPDELGQLRVLKYAWFFGNKLRGEKADDQRPLPIARKMFW